MSDLPHKFLADFTFFPNTAAFLFPGNNSCSGKHFGVSVISIENFERPLAKSEKILSGAKKR